MSFISLVSNGGFRQSDFLDLEIQQAERAAWTE